MHNSQSEAGHSPHWQREIATAFSDLQELLEWLELTHLDQNDPVLAASLKAAQRFPLRVPRSYARRIEKGNPQDPLLLQVLPRHDELALMPGYVDDPVNDLEARQSTGLLKKYAGRALLVTTGACAIHCRYCFRRNFPYQDSHVSLSDPGRTLAFIKQHPDIHEIILSGGDPLSISDRKLAPLMRQLDRIPHIKRLRIHTRLPVVLPSRIDQSFIHWLGYIKKPLTLVIHCNHPNELDAQVIEKLDLLRAAGVHLLNQSVLLRGVNDNAATLIELSEKLFAAGVLPYYLHMLDPVSGAAHFDVEATTAMTIMKQIQHALSGYLVPKLVREIPGELAKIAVTENSVVLFD